MVRRTMINLKRSEEAMGLNTFQVVLLLPVALFTIYIAFLAFFHVIATISNITTSIFKLIF